MKPVNLGEIPHLPAPETDQGIDGEVSLGLPSAINKRFFPLSKRGTKINESLLSSLFTRNLNLSVFSVFPRHFVSAYYTVHNFRTFKSKVDWKRMLRPSSDHFRQDKQAIKSIVWFSWFLNGTCCEYDFKTLNTCFVIFKMASFHKGKN